MPGTVRNCPLHPHRRRGATEQRVGIEEAASLQATAAHVTEAVLTHCIAEVRHALDDDVRQPRFVRTLSRVRYKFVAAVETALPAEPAGPMRHPGTGQTPATAIAVLPFANLSTDPGNEYFCDGLSEELINGLAKAPGLRVVAHSSSFAFKGRNLDAREIGRQVNVGAILEGSVRKSGERLGISAQLIDTAHGYHLWAEQYDRRLEDVFEIQNAISRAILGSLEVELAREAHPPPVKRSPRNMDAYLLYLEGRAVWHRRFAGCLEKAMRCFGQAIEKDPEFALPYIRPSSTCWWRSASVPASRGDDGAPAPTRVVCLPISPLQDAVDFEVVAALAGARDAPKPSRAPSMLLMWAHLLRVAACNQAR